MIDLEPAAREVVRLLDGVGDDQPAGPTPCPRYPQHVFVHRTSFTTEESGTDGASIQAIYGELAADAARNKQVCDDVGDAVRRGRHIIVLTNRVEQSSRWPTT